MKAVIYARVSTDEEKQLNALKNQIDELEQVIRREKWELVSEYIDEGKSGTTKKHRDGYLNLLDDIPKGKFDIIVIKDESRLSRNEADWFEFTSTLESYGIKLYFQLENKFYNPQTDSLTTGIKAILNAQHSRELSRKINQAHKKRQTETQKPCTNGKMWGYTQVRGSNKLEVNNEEAKIVQMIFEKYAIENKGFRTILKELTELNITNRNNKPFSLTTLKRMIRNEKYKGTLVENKTHKNFFTKKINKNDKSEWIIYENAVPAIVSEELWKMANDILDKRSKDLHANTKCGTFTGTHKYSKKIICGVCGESYWHTHSNLKHPSWQCRRYRSYGKQLDKGGCNNIHLKEFLLDKIIRDAIFKFWQNKEATIERILDALNKTLDCNNYSSSIEALESTKKKFMNKMSNLIDMYTEELISLEQFKEKQKHFEDEINRVDNEIKSIVYNNQTILSKKDRLENIKIELNKQISTPSNITNQMIEGLVQKIVVYPEKKINIYLNGGYFETVDLSRFKNSPFVTNSI